MPLSTHSSSNPDRLSPRELADAAILADLTVLVVVMAQLSPFAGLTPIFGAVPFAVLSMRNRVKVVVVAFFVALILVFLLSGFNTATQVVVMATFGGVVGRAFRNGWSAPRAVLYAILVGWSIVASLTLVFLATFSGLRELNLDAARVQWDGIARVLGGVGLDSFVASVDGRIDWMLEHWYLSIPLFQLAISILLTLFTLRIGRPSPTSAVGPTAGLGPNP